MKQGIIKYNTKSWQRRCEKSRNASYEWFVFQQSDCKFSGPYVNDSVQPFSSPRNCL